MLKMVTNTVKININLFFIASNVLAEQFHRDISILQLAICPLNR